ncbi:MAG: hypothetical protein PSV16_00790 [Flavobacterium sp.]|nr:hypothetical protein [Flavobacterium sp.]
MKKFLFVLLGLYCFNSFGQTLLSSHYLNLKKPSEKQQFLTAVNTNNQQVFVFAADKETQTGYKYNSALFYKDSLATIRPDKEDYTILSGYSFDGSGNPEVYWTSDDYKKIRAIYYDFENKKISELTYSIDFSGEEITNSFSENNTFYIITSEDTKQSLKIYMFRNGTMDMKKLDFSSYAFKDGDNQPIRFEKIIERDPIEKIDTKALNPLSTGIKKSKLYVYADKMILTLDYNPQYTQLFEINLATFSITKKSFPYQVLQTSAKTNSYLHQGQLYQLALNESEMVLSSYSTGDSLKVLNNYKVSKNDAIGFKNSPLYSQTGNQRARELKNTKRFLSRVFDSNIGLTVYNTPNDVLLTLGGVREVSSTGDVILGITAGVGMVITGTGGSIDGLLESESQAVYFESLFDKNFKHKTIEQQRLAADYISQFLQEHDRILPTSIFPYQNYFIMGYYDTTSKQYIMRKFQDDGFND